MTDMNENAIAGVRLRSRHFGLAAILVVCCGIGLLFLILPTIKGTFQSPLSSSSVPAMYNQNPSYEELREKILAVRDEYKQRVGRRYYPMELQTTKEFNQLKDTIMGTYVSDWEGWVYAYHTVTRPDGTLLTNVILNMKNEELDPVRLYDVFLNEVPPAELEKLRVWQSPTPPGELTQVPLQKIRFSGTIRAVEVNGTLGVLLEKLVPMTE
jgi:hypothetical protein